MNQVPWRDSDEALMVNWLELVAIDAPGPEKFQTSWISTLEITENNVRELPDAARARWQIANANVRKNHGYYFEQNFGHGNQHLSNLLATLIFLA